MPALPPAYAPFAAFAGPAAGRTEVWRTLAGLAVTVVFYLLALRMVTSILLALVGPMTGILVLQEVALGTTPFGVTVLLFSDLALTAGLALALALLMNRTLASLIGPLTPALHCLLWVTAPLILLAVALMPLQIFSPDTERALGLPTLLKWLPVALPGLLIQSGTEELIFRGYLQQQLGARWSSPWVWMVLPAVLFATLHYAPEEDGALAPLVVLWAACFGLAAADLTARTGNLGAAVGLHFAINAQGLFLIGNAGDLHGLALYTVAVSADHWSQLPYLAVDSVTLLVSWLAARVILRV